MNIDDLFENVIKAMYFPIVSELVDKKAKHVFGCWGFFWEGGGNKKCQYLYINVYFVLQTWTVMIRVSELLVPATEPLPLIV